jgi:cell division septation protein DedD
LAQDDYYYEIQLTNKQLVFYFMAGATGLILSFLAGVMVGRGVDSVAGEVQAARTVQEDRIVAEETPQPTKPATEDLTYAQRLEGEKVEDTLERPAARPAKPFSKIPPAKTAAPVAAPAAGASKAAPRPEGTSGPPTAVVKPGPGGPVGSPPPPGVASNLPPVVAPAAAPPATAPAGGFTIQVGVFKEKARADAIVARLKDKGFAPNMAGGAEGPWSVRVGSYADRVAAERDQARLRDEEKLQAFILKR